MKYVDRYDSLLQYYGDKYNLDWKILKKQMLTESSANPIAISPVRANGLMQFMPKTWKQYDDNDKIPVLDHPFNPEENIEAACKYMRHLYDCYTEIPENKERYKFALAAYNAGRGNINKMLAEARKTTGFPYSYREWVNSGKLTGPWQKWDVASRFLVLITGEHSKETINYVKKIMG